MSEIAVCGRACFLLFFFSVYAVFLLAMPFWAWLFNDYLELANLELPGDATDTDVYKGYLCSVEPVNMHCNPEWLKFMNYTSFADIPGVKLRQEKYNRTNVGCGCGAGVFGENLCPQDRFGYTLSSYISAAPAGGMFAALTAFMAATQLLVTDHISKTYAFTRCQTGACFAALAVFQVGFVMFTFTTDCVFSKLHNINTLVFILGIGLHNLLLATFLHTSPNRDHAAVLVSCNMFFVAIASVIVVTAVQRYAGDLLRLLETMGLPGVHFFTYTEALACIANFGTGPLLLILGIGEGKKDDHKLLDCPE